MRNNCYNCEDSKDCKKDWIENAEYPRDEKAIYLVGRRGVIYEIAGVITSDNQRVIDEKDIPRSRMHHTQDIVDAFLYGEILAWQPIEGNNIQWITEETQKSVTEFIARNHIEPNTILMSEDVFEMVMDYVTSTPHLAMKVLSECSFDIQPEAVRFMGYPIKLVVGEETIKAALL